MHNEALKLAEHRLGKRKVLVIINDGGSPAVTFESGAEAKDRVQFAYDAARIGLYFAENIGDDPAPWRKREQAIETLADEFSISLRRRE